MQTLRVGTQLSNTLLGYGKHRDPEEKRVNAIGVNQQVRCTFTQRFLLLDSIQHIIISSIFSLLIFSPLCLEGVYVTNYLIRDLTKESYVWWKDIKTCTFFSVIIFSAVSCYLNNVTFLQRLSVRSKYFDYLSYCQDLLPMLQPTVAVSGMISTKKKVCLRNILVKKLSVMLNSYSNAKCFFIAFLHARFCFLTSKTELHKKKWNCACKKAMKKCFAFEYEFSLMLFFFYLAKKAMCYQLFLSFVAFWPIFSFYFCFLTLGQIFILFFWNSHWIRNDSQEDWNTETTTLNKWMTVAAGLRVRMFADSLNLTLLLVKNLRSDQNMCFWMTF